MWDTRSILAKDVAVGTTLSLKLPGTQEEGEEEELDNVTSQEDTNEHEEDGLENSHIPNENQDNDVDT